MNPSSRARLAREILREIDRLSSHDEADIIFRCFGLRSPARNGFGDREEPFIIADAPDDVLLGIADHLKIPTDVGNPGFAAPDFWSRSDFKVFISHVSAKKEAAAGLSRAISRFGFDGFVAHEDIEPTKEWSLEIRSALRTCDVLVAMISEGFRESQWCDQEIGAAVGRGIPVFSFYYEKEPHGFAGLYQGVKVLGKQADVLVDQMVQQFIKGPATSRQATRSIVKALRHSQSFAHSNYLAEWLPRLTWLGDDEAAILRESLRDNSQVSGARLAERAVPELLIRFGYSIHDRDNPAIDHDEIPF